MGSQGPGRKRTPSKNGLTGEEDALNVIAKEAEARLAAKRAARAEAREIRMRELERQQKEIYQVQKKYYGLDNLDNKWGDIEQWMEDSERYTRVSRRHASVSDDEERMSVGSKSNIRLDLDAAGAYVGLPQATSSHSHKKSKKKKKHSSKTSNGYDDDLSTLSSRSSKLSDESKRSRSSRLDLQSSAYSSSELYNSSSSYSSKDQVPSYSGYQLPLLHSRKHRGSIYEDSLYSGSRRSSARASSGYSGFLGSSSRTSSRANSACGSPVEDCSSSVASFMRSTASISGLSKDLDHVVIPDLSNVNGRLPMVDDRSERDYLEKGSSRASTISGATLTSLGGTSSRRGSGDTSISADTEASIREIKDSLLEVEEKYRKAMVSNAQLDNEKTNMMYEVDTLKDSLMELEEMLFETRRELEEKTKDLEREKHAHSILQFQFSEIKETLKQSEELLTEIRQLRLKQDGFVREISDLQETIEWKNKKIGALERQKEFSDAIRNERDELRDEVVQLKDILKKHGIVLGPDLATNGETGEEAEQNFQTASTEIREGSSVLGTHQLKPCKDQQQKDLDDRMQGNQQSSHAHFSSTKTALEANENGDLGDQINQGVGQLKNRPEEPPIPVGDDELTATRPKEKIKSEAHIPKDSRYTEELECKVHKDGLMETDQQESEFVKPSKEIKEETHLEPVSGSIHDETDKSGEAVIDDQLKEESVESSQVEKLPKTQGASASNKKKKKKKKNKQKQKQSDKQESDTKMDDKNEMVLSEDNPNQEVEGDLEEKHEKPLGNDICETTMNTDVPHGDKGTNELDCIKITHTNINADDAQDRIQLVTDEADSAEISKTITNFDCPESSNGVLSDDLSNNIISNPATIIDDHTEDLTNPDTEPVIFSSERMPSETETLLPHEPSAQPMYTVGVCIESISSSENIENSSLVGVKEEKSQLDGEVEEQKERLQNITLDCDTNSKDQDNSAHSSSPVMMEKLENEAEKVIQEQPIDQPMESQLQDSIVADVDQEEVETQDEPDEENLNLPSEKVFDGCQVDDTPLIESQIQVIHEDHLSASEANQESIVESEASDQEPKVEHVQEERSNQDQVTLNVELPEDEVDPQVKSDVVLQELKEKDDGEEDEGESFDFDEMDLEASSGAPLKNLLDHSNEDSLLKEIAQEASHEYQRNVKDEGQIQEDEHLEHADKESTPTEHKDDGHATENPQTATDVERCLTEENRQTNSEVRPNDQQHDRPDAFEEHHQASGDVTLSKGVNESSEMETRDVGQEINSSIHHENKASNISEELEATGINKENDRKESKKSGKGKGKGKGKEECKMS
ncbi:leucine-rich repeat flightless-interacting protein 1 isoform X7 [Rhinichthys klamathensis goyatoka]|uniref:leucine-rich repeat flightless-interacting protein 1 isoform X7 n=1 Tax=Rhinichthys klamathensis goyatoka TaxID=3034132 RepID=UPI0024B51B56|nr:leucine-rich repeat flightless-interacting protein 1 isoform X7 [Rhinichthys klamathensis goyatoka]